MIVTEEEAFTKRCPEVRTGLTAGMAVNHHISGDVHDETRCIASGCMMWRWLHHPADSEKPAGFCGKAHG